MAGKSKKTENKAGLTWTKNAEGGYVCGSFGIFHSTTKAGKPSKDFILYTRDDEGDWVAGVFRGTLAECKAEAGRLVAAEITAVKAAAEQAEGEQRPDPSSVTTNLKPGTGSKEQKTGPDDVTKDAGTHTEDGGNDLFGGQPCATGVTSSGFHLVDIDPETGRSVSREPVPTMPSAERRTSPRRARTEPQERKRSVTINRVDWSQLNLRNQAPKPGYQREKR